MVGFLTLYGSTPIGDKLKVWFSMITGLKETVSTRPQAGSSNMHRQGLFLARSPPTDQTILRVVAFFCAGVASGIATDPPHECDVVTRDKSHSGPVDPCGTG